MRALRHQPLLIWALLLALLLGFGFAGITANKALPAPATSNYESRRQADSLLRDLPALNEAIGAGETVNWVEKTSLVVEGGLAAAEGSPRESSWREVADALQTIEQAAGGGREELMHASGVYGSSVMDLVRSER